MMLSSVPRVGSSSQLLLQLFNGVDLEGDFQTGVQTGI
jgi:hypothetical protein